MADDTRVSSSTSPTSRDIEAISFQRIKELSKEEAQSYLTWSNFFSALTNGGDVKQRYLGVRDIVREEEVCKRCEDWKEDLFQKSRFGESSPSVSRGS